MKMSNKATKALVRLALAGLLAYGLVSHWRYLHANASERDSIQYWAAGRLLLHRQNPYDYNAVLELEKRQGYKESKPLVLRTPPWSLFMVLPFTGITAAGDAALLEHVRRQHCRAKPFLGVGYTFAPVAACLVAGQMGFMLLLGVVLFLVGTGSSCTRRSGPHFAVCEAPLASAFLAVSFALGRGAEQARRCRGLCHRIYRRDSYSVGA
jgi:hypothetical protein